MISLFSLATVIAVLICFCWFKYWQATRTIEKVLKTNATLEHTVRTQAGEIKQHKAELNNVQIKQKHTDTVLRGADGTIDEQLHQHGWFRDEASGNRLSGVQSDLSKSQGHDGNEATDSNSQSDVQ